MPVAVERTQSSSRIGALAGSAVVDKGAKSLAAVAGRAEKAVRTTGEAILNTGEAAVVAGTHLGTAMGKQVVDTAIGLGTAVKDVAATAVQDAIGMSPLGGLLLHSASQPLLFSAIAKDPFKGKFRDRAWSYPERALETLEPYARLRLAVVAGRDLLAVDLNGKSDPFAEVYVNDELQATSPWRFMTVNPTWDFHVDLDIYSPLSVVHIRVMDRDNLKSNDLIGFVEFCAADLEPNMEVGGWFELRLKRYMVGSAHSRLRSHTKWRDDDPAKPARGVPGAEGGKLPEDVNGTSSTRATGSQSAREASSKARSRSPMKASMLRRCKTALSLCQGKAAQADPAGEEETRKEGSTGRRRSARRGLVESLLDQVNLRLGDEDARKNAGEVCLRMRLEAAPEKDNEWFAFCFPRPTFQMYPSITLDLGQLYKDIQEIKAMVLHTCQTALCVPRYALGWKYWPLSACLLLWWICACTWPAFVLPSLPLWPLVFLRLLRRENWQERMLVHERTAPLNDRGFEAVASLNDSRRMEVWVTRVLGSMGRGVTQRQKLRELSALIFRDGKPILRFELLVRHLSTQPWVYSRTGERRCPEGHGLVFLGSVGGGHQWACQNPRGCGSYSAGGAWSDVSRYQCVTCSVHICEPCIAQVSRPPLWTSMPTALIPESLELFVVHIEEPLERFRDSLAAALSAAVVPFKPDEEGAKAAKKVTVLLLAATAFLAVFSWLLSGPFCKLVALCTHVAILLGGCACFTMELTVARRLFVCLRASADHKEYQKRRAQGPLEQRWAFFKAEAPQDGEGPGPVERKASSFDFFPARASSPLKGRQ